MACRLKLLLSLLHDGQNPPPLHHLRRNCRHACFHQMHSHATVVLGALLRFFNACAPLLPGRNFLALEFLAVRLADPNVDQLSVCNALPNCFPAAIRVIEHRVEPVGMQLCYHFSSRCNFYKFDPSSPPLPTPPVKCLRRRLSMRFWTCH